MIDKEFEKQLIEKTGAHRQQIIAMEECGELIQSISKMLRFESTSSKTNDKYKENLVEEIADVSICLERLKLIHNIGDEDIQKWINKKEKRDVERYASFSKNDIN